jgi:hypothetical protein
VRQPVCRTLYVSVYAARARQHTGNPLPQKAACHRAVSRAGLVARTRGRTGGPPVSLRTRTHADAPAPPPVRPPARPPALSPDRPPARPPVRPLARSPAPNRGETGAVGCGGPGGAGRGPLEGPGWEVVTELGPIAGPVCRSGGPAARPSARAPARPRPIGTSAAVNTAGGDRAAVLAVVMDRSGHGRRPLAPAAGLRGLPEATVVATPIQLGQGKGSHGGPGRLGQTADRGFRVMSRLGHGRENTGSGATMRWTWIGGYSLLVTIRALRQRNLVE